MSIKVDFSKIKVKPPSGCSLKVLSASKVELTIDGKKIQYDPGLILWKDIANQIETSESEKVGSKLSDLFRKQSKKLLKKD